nr:hypothetical protein [Streptomyces himalayensis]
MSTEAGAAAAEEAAVHIVQDERLEHESDGPPDR